MSRYNTKKFCDLDVPKYALPFYLDDGIL